MFAWTPGYVLKLYYSWWPLDNIEYEARIGRVVHAAGVAAPAVGGYPPERVMIEVEGRHGLIYERVDGRSMQAIIEEEWKRVDEMARLLAQLHASIHRPLDADLPLQHDRLRRQIEAASPLPPHLKEKALERLHALPRGRLLCHGDFHPANVLLSPAGPRVIDWENAMLGNPLADVARSTVLFQAAHVHFPGEQLSAEAIARFNDSYVSEYIALTGADAALIEAWQVPVAAARLSEGIEEEVDFLLSMVGQG